LEFFYGTYQGTEPICGIGGLIFLSNTHLFKFKENVGNVSNNYGELMALQIFLNLGLELGFEEDKCLGTLNLSSHG